MRGAWPRHSGPPVGFAEIFDVPTLLDTSSLDTYSLDAPSPEIGG
jgi:hypothetical protein